MLGWYRSPLLSLHPLPTLPPLSLVPACLGAREDSAAVSAVARTDRKLLTIARALELKVANQAVIVLFKVFVKVTVLSLTNNSFLGESVERILGDDNILALEAFGLGCAAPTGCA